ncbi:secretin N-terminal domain-containing protein [Chitinimonas sp. PSY-7]|uniref:secretin N-terminal domain-containing protein n=1 Tax=Chitinimonas sp. PSY-7 TaxID=3459088 RepID=UPI00403FFDFC
MSFSVLNSRNASYGRRITLLTTLLCLAGCAAQTAYRDGRRMLNEGNVTTGLSKLKEASDLAPESAEYRMAYLNARDATVGNRLTAAELALTAKDFAEAERHYQQVLALDGRHPRAIAGMQSIITERRRTALYADAEQAWKKQDADMAQSRLRSILAEQPNHAPAQALLREIEEKLSQRSLQSGLATAYRKPITVQYKDTSLKTLFDLIARTSGLNILFDKDVRTDQRTSIFLKNSTVESAINMILLSNQLEQRVLDANTILIYPDTQAKRKDYQPVMVRTFYLSNAEAKAVAATMKTIIRAKDIVVDEKLNMVMLRDSPDVIRQAEKLVALHDLPEPEVMLEVEVLEVKRTKLMELGVRWPDQLNFSPLQSGTGGKLTIRQLRNLNQDTITGDIGSISINTKDQNTDTNLLANPRIRTHNREKAKILIGSKVPVITSTLSTSFASESVSYIEVGLKLEVEPTIYPDDEVSIKTSLEVSNILKTIETKSSRAYEIGTRTASAVLRLRDGENQVLAGLINNEDRRTINQVPLLGDVPLLGRLFGSHNNDNAKTEIVLSITPRLIRNVRRPDANVLEFESGTDSSFRRTRIETSTPPLTSAAPNAQPIVPKPIEVPEAIATKPDSTFRWSGPDSAAQGRTIEFQLRYQGDQAINGLPLVIGYDPKVLEIVKVDEGDFLKTKGETVFNTQLEPGQVALNTLLSSATGAKGEGLVATVTAKVINAEAGQTQLSVLSATPQSVDGRSLVPALSAFQLKLAP